MVSEKMVGFKVSTHQSDFEDASAAQTFGINYSIIFSPFQLHDFRKAIVI